MTTTLSNLRSRRLHDFGASASTTPSHTVDDETVPLLSSNVSSGVRADRIRLFLLSIAFTVTGFFILYSFRSIRRKYYFDVVVLIAVFMTMSLGAMKELLDALASDWPWCTSRTPCVFTVWDVALEFQGVITAAVLLSIGRGLWHWWTHRPSDAPTVACTAEDHIAPNDDDDWEQMYGEDEDAENDKVPEKPRTISRQNSATSPADVKARMSLIGSASSPMHHSSEEAAVDPPSEERDGREEVASDGSPA